jgi:hypothetical protein
MTAAEAFALISAKHKRTKSWMRSDGKAGWSWRRAPKAVADKLLKYENRWNWLRHHLESFSPKRSLQGKSH